MRIAVVMTSNIFETSLFLTLDMLKLVQQWVPDLSWAVCTVDAQPVVLSHGLKFEQVHDLSHALDADWLILPGLGLWRPVVLLEQLQGESLQRVSQLVDKAHSLGVAIAASCSAVFVVAQSGVLDDRLATTSWWLAPSFRQQFPQVKLATDRVITHEHRVVCAGAALAHADLMLYLVSTIWSEALARQLAGYLLLEQRRVQMPYFLSGLDLGLSSESSAIRSWIRLHLHEGVSVKSLAKAMGMSPRTLARRTHRANGQSPQQWIHTIQLQTAMSLLRQETTTLEIVSSQVGYQDVSSLRRLFLQHLKMTPSQFRHGMREQSCVNPTAHDTSTHP